MSHQFQYSQDLLHHMYKAYVEDAKDLGVKEIISFEKWVVQFVTLNQE